MKTLNKILILATLISMSFLSAQQVTAQCDTIASICSKHLGDGFISDGQQYRSLLLNDETAEFHATFYGGSTYRLAACSGLTDGNLIFRLYDEEMNDIFNSADYKNAPYWDFQVTNTLNVIIEAQLDQTAVTSGCAVLLIGFKQ